MDFDRLYNRLEREGLFHELEALYSQLPSGLCSGCATCCYDAVPASFVEFLNIRQYMAEKRLLTEALKGRIRTYVLNELKEVNPCPFLIDKRCIIYPVRPLTCRLFGFQSRHEQNKRRKVLIKAHVEQQVFYRDNYDYALPKAVVDHVIPYCHDFMTKERWHIRKSREMYDKLMSFDAPYFISGQVGDRCFNRSLVDWILIELGEEDEIYQARKESLMKNTER